MLFSSEFFYDDMEILAVAEVSFCDPINDFSYRWSIAGETITGIAGNALKLPVGTYSTGQFFELVVTVLNNESLTLATVSFTCCNITSLYCDYEAFLYVLGDVASEDYFKRISVAKCSVRVLGRNKSRNSVFGFDFPPAESCKSGKVEMCSRWK